MNDRDLDLAVVAVATENAAGRLDRVRVGQFQDLGRQGCSFVCLDVIPNRLLPTEKTNVPF
jgi:hypothetical protein